MEYRILGPLQALDDGVVLELGNPQQRALLALLLINANRVVSKDRVLDELWGEASLGKENAMWVYVSRLRSALEPERSDRGASTVLLTRDQGYVLEVDPASIDSHRFEAAAAEGRSLVLNNPERASAVLAGALAMWRGDAYQDFAYEQFAQMEIARLEALRTGALHDRIEADLRRGLAGELIGELEALQRMHPFQERPVAQLMLALYRSGRQAAALRTFERFRRGIGEELGVEPSPELLRLQEQVLLHDPRIQPREPARAPSGTSAVGANPYKGLRAFREDDGDDFFGRDQLITHILSRLEMGHRLIGLVGPSGSGKSSLVKAGLIPALRSGAIPGSEGWLIAQMLPGSRPFAELEAALLRSSPEAPDSLREQLADPEAGLLDAVLRVLPGDDSRLVLVVDQLEELFTLVDDESARRRFLDALLAALGDPHGRIMVVLTLRADFYGRPLVYPEFGTRLGESIVNVVSLTPDELEEAAQKPAERAGVSLEPALLAALLTDVVGQSGALPAFQYALTELFDRRVGDVLTLDVYHDMGGVRGALTQRAEDLFGDLDRDQQDAAKQLFLRLVTISEGNEWGRRRVPAVEVVSLDVDVVAVQAVIESFTRHRLLTLDRDLVSGSPTIEVAHEALLTQWERLRAWIHDAREDVHRHAALAVAMSEWNEAGRETDYLLAGSRLEDYERWAESAVMALTAAERAYLEASVEVREQAERVETERAAQERKVAEAAKLLLAALAPEPPRVVLIGFERGRGAIHEQVLNGFDQAGRDFEFRKEFLSPKSDPLAEIGDVLESGPGLVIVDSTFVDSTGLATSGVNIQPLVASYPDVWIADIAAGLGTAGSVLEGRNVSNVAYAPEEASFLVGVAAARTSETGTVGFIGGAARVIDKFRAGFEAGARHADSDVEVLSRYLHGHPFTLWTDREQASEAARDFFEQGADVIYHAAGEAGRSIFEVALALSGNERHLWGIGVDVDEILLVDAQQGRHVLTSMVMKHDIAVRIMIERFLDGTLEPGNVDLSLANGGVDYSTTGGSLERETIDELERLREQIISGELSVPRHVDGPATSPVRPDVLATVTFDGEHCELSGLDGPRLGQNVRFLVENRSPAEASVGVFKFRRGTTTAEVAASDPFELADPPGHFHTAVGVTPGRTHAMTVELSAAGEWGVVCFGSDGQRRHAPLIHVPEV